MLTADRITLAPARARILSGAPQSVLIGHAPGRVAWRRLLELPTVTDRIAGLGFDRQIKRLQALAAGAAATEPGDRALMRLERLPIPIDGTQLFDTLFPEARTQLCAYRTALGGDVAWLPLAVQDFFAAAQGASPDLPTLGANGGRVNSTSQTAGLLLWVVVVPESEGAAAMQPDPAADQFGADPWNDLGPFEIALRAPDTGLIGFPDLERLSIAAGLSLPAAPDAAKPSPTFLPCDTATVPANLASAPQTGTVPDRAHIPLALGSILDGLARLRPDLHAVLGVPFADDTLDSGYPGPDAATTQMLRTLADGAQDASGAAGGGAHRMQMTYPYLARGNASVRSACGLLLATMARSTADNGAWRSIAGTPLLAGTRAWPPVALHAAADLRETARVGVLLSDAGSVMLEDEQVAAPALSFHRTAGSGEVSRFLGWLRRQLRRYGDQLLFNADPEDQGVAIPLRGFLRRLHAAGALGGLSPEDGFTLRQRSGGPGILIFEIELLLAMPIDRIHVTLSADRVDFAVGGATRV